MGSALLTAWVAMILLAEAVIPAEPSPTGAWARRFRNIALGVLALAASPLLLWGVGKAIGAVPPPMTTPFIVQLLILDLWTYAMHRAYHRVPLMWRFHAPHHLDEHLDVTSAFRFHVGEVLISGALRLVPALVFGISIETLVLLETILICAAIFHHSNIKLPRSFERALSYIIVTPSIHWVHHHNIRSDTDANYAAVLSLWDRLFGSHSATKRWRGMPIGTEGMTERSLLGLLSFPFAQRR
jgi:sterol desaturase/sphingolipid hydroxylase (fatty acid hydroxylase superfamily)